MHDDEDLTRLLTEARKGVKQALGAVLALLRPWMRHQAEGLLGQRLRARMDGSDVVQEVHVRAFERFDQFRGESVPQLRVWVGEILNNVVTDCRRRHGAGKRDAGREEGGDLLPERQGAGTTPSQGVMRREDQARLIEAVQSLPERQRLVVRLRCFDGLSFEEVARHAGVTAGNARVLMVRALERLRTELGDEHDG